MKRHGPLRTRNQGRDGQALVEFSMVIVMFLILLMAVVDLGRGIYIFNGVSQAAREIARTTSVHPGVPLGTSGQVAATVAVQQGLVPGLSVDPLECVDDAGATVPGATCFPGSRVKVTTRAPFAPLFGLLDWFGVFDFSSSSSIQITNL